LKSSETPAQSTDSQIAEDREVPTFKNMLTWLTIWFWFKKIRCRLTEQSATISKSAQLLWNSHHEFGSCLFYSNTV